MRTGFLYYRELCIPGYQSGGEHVCVVVSSTECHSATRHAVLAPLRSCSSAPWRIPVRHKDIQSFGDYRLDQERCLDLSQIWSVPLDQLPAALGRVHERVISSVRAAIPRQFQLERPAWLQRGEIVDVRDRFGSRRVILIQNDRGLAMGLEYYSALSYHSGLLGWHLETVNAETIYSTEQWISNSEQLMLSRRLEVIFGLSSAYGCRAA